MADTNCDGGGSIVDIMWGVGVVMVCTVCGDDVLTAVPVCIGYVLQASTGWDNGFETGEDCGVAMVSTLWCIMVVMADSDCDCAISCFCCRMLTMSLANWAVPCWLMCILSL